MTELEQQLTTQVAALSDALVLAKIQGSKADRDRIINDALSLTPADALVAVIGEPAKWEFNDDLPDVPFYRAPKTFIRESELADLREQLVDITERYKNLSDVKKIMETCEVSDIGFEAFKLTSARVEAMESELVKLQAENERLFVAGQRLLEEKHKPQASEKEVWDLLNAARSELAELRKDAERYQLLVANLGSTTFLAHLFNKIGSSPPTKEQLDQALDAAMQAERQKLGGE